MAIATNNNNLGTTIGNLYTGNGMEVQFFTVTIKDASGTAVDLRAHDSSGGAFHKDGLVDRILGVAQTKGTVVHFNVKNDNSGVVTIAMEGQFATAANMATAYDNNSVPLKFRFSATSTTEDGTADISGTTVAADKLV
tara:strand:+ start:705 stop:1118 length:414 start_codon:yes stop_codon:yes gene_type:complete